MKEDNENKQTDAEKKQPDAETSNQNAEKKQPDAKTSKTPEEITENIQKRVNE